jgi:hypothetical protein
VRHTLYNDEKKSGTFGFQKAGVDSDRCYICTRILPFLASGLSIGVCSATRKQRALSRA